MSAAGRCAWLTAAILTVGLLAACGGSDARRHPLSSGSAIVLMATGPNSLDPAVGDNVEALEADYVTYTPLLTYVHAGGVPGSRTIPGLAEAVPTITDGGTIYTLTLDPGLVYSNGRPVKASDFSWALERAIKLWPEAPRLLTPHIVGATAFAGGRAKTISGVTTNDSTGAITIHLTAPYGQFDNLLALPVLAPVPAGTPLHDEQSSPPPGVGLYKFANVVPGRSFSLIRNPLWTKFAIPFLPSRAHVDVDVQITGNSEANVNAVLNNSADVFDWPDPIPTNLLAEIQRKAASRYRRRVLNTTYLAFLNVTRKPFSNQQARQAVRAALDQNTLVELDAGRLLKGCYVLPPGVYGHPGDVCPDGNRTGSGNLSLAKALVQRSGVGGSPVTVWTPAQAPAEPWMTYYTSLLDRIGFRARLRVVPPADYYRTIGDQRLHPQTGYGEYYSAIPYPSDYYKTLTGRAIRPTGNRNWGEVDDPYINRTVRLLRDVPATNLDAVSGYWRQVELHTANQAYVAVLGYPTVPEFVSDRVDLGRLTFNPVIGYDWSSLRFN